MSGVDTESVDRLKALDPNGRLEKQTSGHSTSQPCHGWLINLKKYELVENEDVEPEIMAGAG